MAKRMMVICLALVLLLSGCAGVGKPGGELELIAATDLHYLAPSLTDKGEFFTQMLAAADGKVTYYCEELVDAFLAAGFHYFDTAHGYLNGQRKRGIHEGFPASVGTGAGGGVAGAGHSAGSEPDPLHRLPVLHRGLPHGNSHPRSVRLSQRQAAYRKHGSR